MKEWLKENFFPAYAGFGEHTFTAIKHGAIEHMEVLWSRAYLQATEEGTSEKEAAQWNETAEQLDKLLKQLKTVTV